jgi:hypothetical protein
MCIYGVDAYLVQCVPVPIRIVTQYIIRKCKRSLRQQRYYQGPV